MKILLSLFIFVAVLFFAGPIITHAQYGGGGGGFIPVPVPSIPKPDVNNDGVVNEYDFAILMSQWGQTGNNLSGDVNHDGVVDEYDLSILMADWS